MSYVVYHNSLSPEYLVEEKDYIQYLLTGDWFDRPQITNKGNRDETEWLLRQRRLRESKDKPEPQRLQHDGREVLCDSDVEKRTTEVVKNIDAGTTKSSEIKTLEVKKRGRPKKDNLNVDPNN